MVQKSVAASFEVFLQSIHFCPASPLFMPACNPSPRWSSRHPLALSLSLQYFSSHTAAAHAHRTFCRTPLWFISPLCLASFRIPHQLLHKVKFLTCAAKPQLNSHPQPHSTLGQFGPSQPQPFHTTGSSLTGLFLGSAGLCRTHSSFLGVFRCPGSQAELGCSFVLWARLTLRSPPPTLNWCLTSYFPKDQELSHFPARSVVQCFSPFCFHSRCHSKVSFPHPRWSPLLLLWTSPLPHSKDSCLYHPASSSTTSSPPFLLGHSHQPANIPHVLLGSFRDL